MEGAGKIISVIGDEDTVTGFLLAGIGQQDTQGKNFLVVDAKTTRDQIEETFEKFIARGDVGLIIINQPVADQIRARLAAHTSPFPMVLEIPSKDTPYDINKDPMMKRITQMLGEDA